ncbi:hypothetical protein BH24ACT4_BH24ACT4_01170 [soil metagenome]
MRARGARPEGPYDLVVIDGLDPNDGDEAVTRQVSDRETAAAVAHLARRGVVIVENQRAAQRRVVEAAARSGHPPGPTAGAARLRPRPAGPVRGRRR